MPIYAYRCEACGFAKDVLQKVSDPQLTVCLSCGAPSFRKQVTAAGFQLKGTGWYATDFRGGATPAAAAAGSSSDNPTTAKTESAGGGDQGGSGDNASATKSDSSASAVSTTSSNPAGDSKSGSGTTKPVG